MAFGSGSFKVGLSPHLLSGVEAEEIELWDQEAFGKCSPWLLVLAWKGGMPRKLHLRLTLE